MMVTKKVTKLKNNAVGAASTKHIAQSILIIRGHKVLLDSDLAVLYDVETKVLLQAIKRNITRFPADFMLQLTADEWSSLKSQIVTLKTGRGQHRKYLPYAFTEQGVAMLSPVLNSERAIAVNIEIMRAFVRMRKLLASNKELAQQLKKLERNVSTHDEAIRELMNPPALEMNCLAMQINRSNVMQARLVKGCECVLVGWIAKFLVSDISRVRYFVLNVPYRLVFKFTLIAGTFFVATSNATIPAQVTTNTDSNTYDSPSTLCSLVYSYWPTYRSDVYCGSVAILEGCPNWSDLNTYRTIQVSVKSNAAASCPSTPSLITYSQGWFAKCPTNSTYDHNGGCNCVTGYDWDASTQSCLQTIYFLFVQSPKPSESSSCSANNKVGDPINPVNGAVTKTEGDCISLPSTTLSFSRFYNSIDTGNTDLSGGWRRSYSRSVVTKYSTIETQTYLQSANSSSQYPDPATACTGGFAEIKSRVPQWTTALASYTNGNCVLTKNGNIVGAISVHSNGGSFAAAPTPVAYDLTRDDGQLIRFIVDGSGAVISPPGFSLKLQKTVSGFTVTDSNDNVEQYDTNDKLLTVTSRSGVIQTMSYDGSGRLSGVSDSFGRQLNFGYDGQSRLSTVIRQ